MPTGRSGCLPACKPMRAFHCIGWHDPRIVSLISGCAAVPRRCGTAAARSDGPFQAWSPPRPSSCRRQRSFEVKVRKHDIEEDQHRRRRRYRRRSTTTKFQPANAAGIVHIAPRHAGEAQEVHREERQVDADEGDPENAPCPRTPGTAGRSSCRSSSRSRRRSRTPRPATARSGNAPPRSRCCAAPDRCRHWPAPRRSRRRR